MTLLLRMIAELLVAASAWLVVLAAIGIAVGLVVAAGLRRPVARRRLVLGSVLGAAIAMALAHRLRLPEPALLRVGRRDILIMWSVMGAAAGSLLAILTPWERSQSGRTPDGPPRPVVDGPD